MTTNKRLDAIRQKLNDPNPNKNPMSFDDISYLLSIVEKQRAALEDIKYHADNPFNSKDGTTNAKWLSYCQDVAQQALKCDDGGEAR